jgi:hypothetical protein
MLGLCSCGFGMHSFPLSNFGSSVAMIYSLDAINHRLLRYTPNDLGTATLDSAINLPSGMTATLVTTDAGGNLYIGGYTSSANMSEVLVYDAAATDDDAPLRTLPLTHGKLSALAVDRQGNIYVAQQNDRATVNVYSNNSSKDTPVRTIDPSAVDLNDLAVDSAGQHILHPRIRRRFVWQCCGHPHGVGTAGLQLWRAGRGRQWKHLHHGRSDYLRVRDRRDGTHSSHQPSRQIFSLYR